MIKIENTQVVGWEPAIRGMRNPKNSWDRMDSYSNAGSCEDCENHDVIRWNNCDESDICIGPNDHKLMMSLAKGGPVHAKYRRYIDVYVDITAPLYWWKEFDTYRTAFAPNPFDIEENSCSTMHKLTDKEFTLDDFSNEHLLGGSNHYDERETPYVDIGPATDELAVLYSPSGVLEFIIIPMLNECRERYLIVDKEIKNLIEKGNVEISELTRLKDLRKKYWWQLIQLLPSSYNQKRTVKLTYETCAAMYPDRKNHKQDEWRELCKWIESLPYSEIIIGAKESED